jgi:hypothetical protein
VGAAEEPRRWDDEGCFALDYLRSEGDIEPRRALVRAVKAGNPTALDHAALLMSAAVDERERPHSPYCADTNDNF